MKKKNIWDMVLYGNFPKNWEHEEEMEIMKKNNGLPPMGSKHPSKKGLCCETFDEGVKY